MFNDGEVFGLQCSMFDDDEGFLFHIVGWWLNCDLMLAATYQALVGCLAAKGTYS